jgi:hypothetical protein
VNGFDILEHLALTVEDIGLVYIQTEKNIVKNADGVRKKTAMCGKKKYTRVMKIGI